MEMWRVLIADDHPVFRKGLRALLTTLPEVEIAGEAGSGEEAITLADTLQPDIVLMDLQMPGGSGIAATRTLAERHPRVRVLMLTLFEDDDSVFAALRAGARGYILKDAEEEDLLRAVQAVGRGEAIFSPAVATRVLAFFAANRPAAPRDVFPTLTDREREILHLIAQGRANPAIAHELSLSVKTVGNYVGSIFAKLQVADRAEAIIRARDAGLV